MKYIFIKSMLGILLLSSCSSMVYAGLYTMLQKGGTSIIKTVGDNPLWIAYATLALCTYKSFVAEKDIENDEEAKSALAQKVALWSIGIAAASYTVCAGLRWLISKNS